MHPHEHKYAYVYANLPTSHIMKMYFTKFRHRVIRRACQVYIDIYIYLHIYICIYIHIYIHVYIYIHIYIHTYVYIYIHIFMYIRPRIEKSHSGCPRTAWCEVIKFHKNGIRPLIRANGTIFHPILCFNLRAVYSGLK